MDSPTCQNVTYKPRFSTLSAPVSRMALARTFIANMFSAGRAMRPIGGAHHLWRRGFLLGMLALTVLVAGCATSFDSSDKPGRVRTISGEFKVLDVQPWMNSAVVRFEGRRCMAWWDSYSAFYVNGHFTHQLPTVVGERYHFDGLLTDRDVYLGQVWGNQPPPRFGIAAAPINQSQIMRHRYSDRTGMESIPLRSGLKLPAATEPSTYSEPTKQHKIPLPTHLGS